MPFIRSLTGLVSVILLIHFHSCRAEVYTVTEACTTGCYNKDECNAIKFDHDAVGDVGSFSGKKGSKCCAYHDENGECQNMFGRDSSGRGKGVVCYNSTQPPASKCIASPEVTFAATYFAVAIAIIMAQVAASTAVSAGSSAASAGSSAASSGSSAPNADPSSVGSSIADLATSSQGSGGLSLDSVDIELDLDLGNDAGDDDLGITVKPDSVGRCRLVINNPFPEEEGKIPTPKNYKPKFVLPMPYSIAASGKKLARLPKPVGACCKRRLLPQKALAALSLPAGDEDLWSKVAEEATRRYQGTPKRNDGKRLRKMRILELISKLYKMLGGQGLIGMLLKIISGSPIDIPLIIMVVLAFHAFAAGKFQEKMRRENYEESQKAVEDYVKKDLTEELAKQGLHCLYAMEKRRSLTFSLSPKKLCGIASTVSSPAIFIDSSPLTKKDVASKADKFFNIAGKANQAVEMASKV